MRLATFNILHGRSLADGQVSNERLVEACASLQADVLCLQEVDRGQARSGYADQTAEVAKATGAASWRFEPALVGEPGGTWRAASDEDPPAADEPAYGIGLVSRVPVETWNVVRLPAARLRAPVAVPGGRGRFILLPDEPRVGLAATLAQPGPAQPGSAHDSTAQPAPLLATTHLSFVPGYNLLQLRRLTSALARLAPSCLLLGDLNLPRPFPEWVTGWRPLATARTYPADSPLVQVDHVLASGPPPRVRSVEARRLPLSDHLALVVELDR
jgi:endonuclease/exonuclease/phosphatase family metal-dependent hydrolase